MRKVLFVHNGPLYRDRSGNVFGTHFTEAVKQRYLLLGDHVTFLMREDQVDGSHDAFSLISPRQFRFVSVPNLLSPIKRIINHAKAMNIIEAAVNEADLIVARIPSLVSRLAVKCARKQGKPYLVECVACNWDALSNHNWKAKISAPWYFLMQRMVVQQSPYVIYVTDQFLQRRYPTFGRQIALSDVQLQSGENEILERRLRLIDSRAESKSVVNLVTVADIGVPYKGQGDIIKMMPTLAAAGIQVKYHLIGGGDPSRLKVLARSLGVEECIVFHGIQRHERIFTLLDEMDIYVQPSHTEGLPRAVIEALSRGVPIVGSSAGGIPELLDPNRVFKPGDGQGFIQALFKLLPRAEQAADARRNFVRSQDFREETLSARRVNFYNEFLADQGFAPVNLSEVSDTARKK